MHNLFQSAGHTGTYGKYHLPIDNMPDISPTFISDLKDVYPSINPCNAMGPNNSSTSARNMVDVNMRREIAMLKEPWEGFGLLGALLKRKYNARFTLRSYLREVPLANVYTHLGTLRTCSVGSFPSRKGRGIERW